MSSPTLAIERVPREVERVGGGAAAEAVEEATASSLVSAH
jgi:hypothetical protein